MGPTAVRISERTSALSALYGQDIWAPALRPGIFGRYICDEWQCHQPHQAFGSGHTTASQMETEDETVEVLVLRDDIEIYWTLRDHRGISS